jgi:hypothetical protein
VFQVDQDKSGWMMFGVQGLNLLLTAVPTGGLVCTTALTVKMLVSLVDQPFQVSATPAEQACNVVLTANI